LTFVRQRLSKFDLKYGFIFKTWEELDSLPPNINAFLNFLHPNYKLILDNPYKIPFMGHPLQCWTVDDPEVVKNIFNLPQREYIRSIMTNDIELATEFGESNQGA
jgi:hypothetical protein